ncbi:Lrp/AsnC family transcriptional regulator [Nitrospirillum iridis]|uniref:Lrp/AsnC family transcriptional regulator n=1 Tax=Nitrospirillum iridis TaxID=765888 RepID=A0A7X0EBH8_9PROT|nr:Lrp/AsnC family transcriptional regulator [Nitrospirillum iridis]MBB6250588.1 Lrp/AsnC family transcriptional regulator [Nitrospirillum iridis]
MVQLDKIDIRLLQLLQDDASLSIAQLADSVALSANACWRRVKQLEEAGVIRRRVALLDAGLMGCGITVFVAIRTNQHNEDWLDTFARGVADIPEIVEFYRMSGDVDYLLKVLVADIPHYDRVYKQLIKVTQLTDVSSSFAMERIKYTTAIPLPRPAA